jgi:diguanylate cyclase (GGDEF)-like protein/PAS domain S-box-containing protein
MSEFQNPEIYRTILEALRVGLCVIDRQRRIVFWNDGAERITGYLRHEVVGHECIQNILKHCDGTQCELCGDRCPLTAVLHEGKPVEAAAFMHHKAGHRLLVHLWVVPLRDQHGSVIGAVQSFEQRHLVPNPDRREKVSEPFGFLDAVTGVANQAMTQSRVRESLATFLELHVPFGILCVQLGRMEQFRANFGQEAIGSLLRVSAQSLESSLRPADFVGRWGEDKFLAVLTNCRVATLKMISERVRKLVASGGIDWWGEERHVAVSVKIVTARAHDTLASLLQRINQNFSPPRTGEQATAAAGDTGAAPSG